MPAVVGQLVPPLELFTVTVSEAVPTLSAESVALTAMVSEPFGSAVVSNCADQLFVPVAVSAVPPPRLTCTELIELPSLTVPVTVSVPETGALAAGVVMATTGELFTVTVSEAVPTLSAESVALTAMVAEPFGSAVVSNCADQLFVPVAVSAVPPPRLTSTELIELPSLTVPVTVSVPETGAVAAGVVMATTGVKPTIPASR